jgi:tetratricopeptide (TPR) repeat protein
MADEASILLRMGRYKEAEQAATDAIPEFQRENEVDEEAVTWAITSNALLQEGRLKEAVAASDKAVKLSGHSQDQQVRLDVKIYVASVHGAQGKTEEAKRELHSAVERAQQMGDVSLIFDGQLALAEIESRKPEIRSDPKTDDLAAAAEAKGFLRVARKAKELRSSISQR